MRKRNLTKISIIALAIATAVSLAACSAPGTGSSSADRPDLTGGFPSKPIVLVAPASAGGGYDNQARGMQRIFNDGSYFPVRVNVENNAGGSGTIGLNALFNDAGNPYHLMITGLSMVGGVITTNPRVKISELTPIARLSSESTAFVVPSSSPFKTIKDFVNAWKADPRAVPIAGGAQGAIDHQVVLALAEEAGVSLSDINFISFSGAEAFPAIMSGQVAVGMGTVAEILPLVQAGDVRFLAISADEPSDMAEDVPTLKESGYDVSISTWRGIVAAPDIPDDVRDYLIEVISKAQASEAWAAMHTSNGWSDEFLVGEDFHDFLVNEQVRLYDVLSQAGLAK